MPRRYPRWYVHPLTVTAGILALVVALHYGGWFGPVEAAVMRGLSPVHYRFLRLGNALDGWWQGRSGNADLRREAQALQASWRQLVAENQRLKEELREFAQLRQQTDFLAQRQLPAVTAHVVSRQMNQEAHLIVLDRGRRSGIAPGAPVVVQDGILVGRVVEAGDEHAQVMLVSDGRSATAVALDRSPDVTGVVSGEFGARLKLDLIPLDQGLEVGDLVVTSGQEASVPRGLVVGSVSRVSDTPGAGFFHDAYVQPLVSGQQVNTVAVLIER